MNVQNVEECACFFQIPLMFLKVFTMCLTKWDTSNVNPIEFISLSHLFTHTDRVALTNLQLVFFLRSPSAEVTVRLAPRAEVCVAPKKKTPKRRTIVSSFRVLLVLGILFFG